MPDFRSSGFFVLRTPLLPFEELEAWSRDPSRERLRERLREAIARPEVREALFVASPSLEEGIEVWQREPDSKRGRNVERSLVRYFTRMTARATPFGLFAGCSVGAIGDGTRLEVAGRSEYGRRTRLDMEYLCALADALAARPEVRRSLVYHTNSSLYRAAGRVRYVESRFENGARSHRLVAVEETDYLLDLLSRAQEGAALDGLAEALVAGGASREEGEAYLVALIESQILVSDVAPTVTGDSPARALAAELRACPAALDAANDLDRALDKLGRMDETGLGVEPRLYREMASSLEALPAKTDLARLLQVDMFKPAPAALLGGEVLSEIARGIEVLRRLPNPDPPDGLARFRRAFAERFGGREVALTEALDEECGVGFEPSTAPGAEASPLLEGLTFPSPREDTAPWGPWQSLLLRKLVEGARRGDREIVLEEKDLAALGAEEPAVLPDAFHAMVTVAARSEEALARGDFLVALDGISGPSGARLLGRFCDADRGLRERVESHLREEEALAADAIFAEIVHLPEGRLGNVLARPVLRAHEIGYLGRSGAAEPNRIPVGDLSVSVSGDRIVLRSARHGREVIPRLTSAHNYTWRSLGVYRFLCALQHQGVTPRLQWTWGALRASPFLPRVVTGRVVLARAGWIVGSEEARRLAGERGDAALDTVRRWREERGLPRHVMLAEGDQLLLLDLENALSVDSFVHALRRREPVRLLEMFPAPDALCARGPEGRFLHEIVVPFVRARAPEAAPSPALRPPVESRAPRRLPPGSDWLYAKLYTGTGTVDEVLREVVVPFVRRAEASGAAERWFFLRYGDPEWHLRVRLHGSPERLHAEVLPDLEKAVAPLLEDGRVWRVQLDTYDREVERYGGPESVALAERISHADSEAVVAILEGLSGDEGARSRWRLALLGIHLLLEDCGFAPAERRDVIREARAASLREFRADRSLKQQIGAKFRALQDELDRLLAGGGAPAAFRARSERLAAPIQGLRALERAGGLSQTMPQLALSFIHMHANRLLRSSHRAQELVIYDLLDRLYRSWASRAP